MEIIFEILGWLLQCVAEILLQVFAEVLVELGVRTLAAPLNKSEPNPMLIAAGSLIMGAVAGGLSLIAFPMHFIAKPNLRVLNLVLSPLVAGCVMSVAGGWGKEEEEKAVDLYRFLRGFLFALGMSLVRYFYTQN